MSFSKKENNILSEFDEIEHLKNGSEKTEKLIDYYSREIKTNLWLNNDIKNSIIRFKDRTEYKKNNQYHRLNGPAIDYGQENLNVYYYKGHKMSKEDWNKITIKELRKIKIKKLNNNQK